MGRGEWGEAHILAHKAGYVCRVCVENVYAHILTHLDALCVGVSRCSVSRRVCRDCMMYDVCLDEIDVYDLVETNVCNLVEISRSS